MFDNEKAFQLAIEYMRCNHIKSSRHADYFRLFFESYEKINGFMTSGNPDEYAQKPFNIPGYLLNKN